MFGNRKRLEQLQQENAQLRQSLQETGALEYVELQQELEELKKEIRESRETLVAEQAEVDAQVAAERQQVEALK